MKPKHDFISLAIWELSYDFEAKRFEDLMVNKAKYLKVLEGKDLFEISEAEAERTTKQINAITSELTSMYGFKTFADTLRDQYMQSLDNMYEFFCEENNLLKNEIYSLTASNIFLEHVNSRTSNSLSFMTDIALNHITPKQEKK